ncbi:hypothetical protein PFICI_01918 [Pestalotiopsis fici W106-1]|uniref:Uncharacterized protein n=1 Tax=Pestalotiopsis fici (strain W106-1 / CGMCC3.15140) TaxID=1229662 RepID=W3XQ49_PESFW|nr:uncharacterized protein PFICI_01918 [Pestalotiopsis fici W106-1]ETS88090.1 hypothetical protein PFICI_01918 [Pestalotiopsis fici W106-1]
MPAAPAVSDHAHAHAPDSSSASPHLANHPQQLITTPNGSSAPGPDGLLHPGLRLDMRNANGVQRDGRVRNPIPSKLKGKTDEKKGNFRVMHMDISNTSESQARYDAAKRSSENTALQAKMAETDHYVSHHRRANYARTKTLKEPEEEAAAPPLLPPRTTQLTPEEVKTEQARLLTLLRTLPHDNIVNQICKALAFFGGIPDAPPPPSGKFPDSGDANGPGNLFVGWLSEIFPDLDRPRMPNDQPSAPAKRPRGRPKGSKATKARKDKGIKKNNRGPDGTGLSGQDGDQPGDDEGWEDVNDSVLDVSRQGESVEDRVLSLLQTPPQNAGASNAMPGTGGPSGFTSINPASTPVTSVKKRGRPKGSKNKAKDPNLQNTPQQAEVGAGAAPTTTSTFQPALNVESTPTAPVEGKKKPKTGKKAANASAASATQLPQSAQVGTSTSYIPPPTLPLAATRNPGPVQTGVNGSNGNAEGIHVPRQIQNMDAEMPQPINSVTPQVKESSITGAKRKRQNNKPPAKSADYAGTNDPATSHLQTNSSGLPLASGLGMDTPQRQSNAIPTADMSAAAPPAKKPRKSNAGTSKRKSTTGAAGELSSVTSSENAQNQTSSQMIDDTTQARSQPEGLQAHYDRFASLSNNTDHQTQAYSGQQQAQQQVQQQVSNSVNTSSAPVEGLEAHYERFQSVQNRQHNAQQPASARQQSRQVPQHHSTQSASPVPPQISKTPQMATLPSQQQNRASTNTPNYYAQSQTPGFIVQQGSYTTNQRQPQNTSTSSPGTGLVSHVAHSPQYGTQSSNSPLLSNDNTFRGSPSLGFAPRRTTSASPMDNAYRTNSVTAQAFVNSRQTPATSHAGVASTYSSFTDNSLFDLQSFDSASGNNMGLGGTGSYSMGNSNVQRANSASNNSSAYAGTTMTNGAYDQTGLNKGAMNNTYRGQPRWA